VPWLSNVPSLVSKLPQRILDDEDAMAPNCGSFFRRALRLPESGRETDLVEDLNEAADRHGSRRFAKTHGRVP